MERDKRNANFRVQSLLILCLAGLAIFPAIADDYYLHLIIICFIWAVVASAWNLIMGYAGIFSFAQLAFFAIGAYSSAILECYSGLSPWLGLLAGGIMAGIAGFIIGIPCFRLRGLYIVLVTMAFHQVIPVFIKIGSKWTGGDVGMFAIPHYSIFGYNFGGGKIYYYYLTFALFLGFNAAIYKIIRSKIGLAFVALRDSDTFAESLGVNREKYNLIVFVISAAITGVMGAVYVHYLQVATPRLLEIEIFVGTIMMVVIGGLGKFPGVIIASFLVTFLNEFLRTAGAIRPILFGGIIMAVILLVPGGLSSLIEYIVGYRKKVTFSAFTKAQLPSNDT